MEKPPIRILLIEDDEDDYVLVRKLLSQDTAVRYDLQWAPTYGAALEAMGKDRHDVYLLDYQLGDRTGLDLLHEVNGKGSTVPVIFLTGHADYEVDVEAVRAGASDYLVKSQISTDLLSRSIRYALERKRLERQLRQAQKLEALGTLSGGIAHDFNNILAAIIGFTELIRDHSLKDSRQQRHAARVLQAAMRGRALVKQMLTFSRRTEEEKKPVQLSSIVKETFAFLRQSIPSTISIRVNVNSENGLIIADPVQVQQVIMNLATNAAHAMRAKGGVLDVELSDFSGSPSGEDPQEGPYMKLVVHDTGMGMGPDVVDRIFDPFFTTKGVGEGTGLGLSVVLGIVKQAHGHITVDSEQGKGSTFTVYFPKATKETEAEPETEDELPTGSEQILFVDDEEALVEMGEDLLAELGYEVVCRMNSREALALVKDDPSRFDLVVTDQTMPEMTGLELASEILVIRPDMPIIMCTGYSQLVDADKARAAGIRAFVMKPLTKREIAGTIRKVIDG
jgi:signal transduction histidine kinase